MGYLGVPIMKIPSELGDVLMSNPEILGGTVCFKGTRVPVEVFLDYMSTGYSLDRFLHGFKSVQRDQALTVLEWQNGETRKTLGLELVA